MTSQEPIDASPFRYLEDQLLKLVQRQNALDKLVGDLGRDLGAARDRVKQLEAQVAVLQLALEQVGAAPPNGAAKLWFALAEQAVRILDGLKNNVESLAAHQLKR